MSHTPLDYITARAPEYAVDPRISSLIEMATGRTSVTAFGTNTYQAVALLTLHWMAMDDRSKSQNGNPTGGTLALEQEGSLKRQYMVDFNLEARYPDLTQTRWGMELIGLQKGSVVNFLTRTVNINGNRNYNGSYTR